MSTRDWNGRNAAYGGLLAQVIDTLKRSRTLADRQGRREPRGKPSGAMALYHEVLPREFVIAEPACTRLDQDGAIAHRLGVSGQTRDRSEPGDH